MPATKESKKQKLMNSLGGFEDLKIIKSLLFFFQHSQIKGRVNVRTKKMFSIINTKINENYEI